MSMPARAPIAKAANVQAAKVIPRKGNRPGVNGDMLQNVMVGRPPGAKLTTASGGSKDGPASPDG
jgi:hypothetical protein